MCRNAEEYVGGIFGEVVPVKDGYISVKVKANSGEIWLPVYNGNRQVQPIEIDYTEKKSEKTEEEVAEPTVDKEIRQNITFEEMTVEELQAAILDRMSQNGPVTERMKRDVMENVYHNSLVNWIKSFN